ncbi:class I SAM-dependent methyltransferase [Plantactinospora endophytica]|uniref:Type 12 methyltransferase n=1 Tax=Plantactinospora endophytica TaxID=673535 RepID=A0ABQ4E2P5_9ACTN|nr:class I SAM-dependent methyltransferase [Plantactinospora endophytica]GIG88591.1 type 12 methyltransferase [Plantactinospora endophytica]
MSTEIDIRTEAGGLPDPAYETVDFGKPELLARGIHREAVGGYWDELGELQFEFLRQQGLKPDNRFLDVGCGSLRAGRLIAAHLDPGNYYGIDINHSLLTTGYDHELDDAGRARLPRTNLRATDRFDADFGVPFDMAIAQSVFTHISLNWLRLCLYRVAKVMPPGGRFYVTFFEQPEGFPIDGIGWSGRLFTERNAFWYYQDDMRWAASRSPWSFRYMGDWGHPRDQRMVEYTRLDGEVGGSPN